jgi:hypothetical protein
VWELCIDAGSLFENNISSDPNKRGNDAPKRIDFVLTFLADGPVAVLLDGAARASGRNKRDSFRKLRERMMEEWVLMLNAFRQEHVHFICSPAHSDKFCCCATTPGLRAIFAINTENTAATNRSAD